MRHIFFLAVIVISIINPSFSQSEIPLELPSITPKSPEAASMGMLNNVPINPATGQMSYTVPIHTISVDGNQWPISLQYNYGGFILEKGPSMAGWGWNLNAYGTITREVRGLPDWHPYGYMRNSNVRNMVQTYVHAPYTMDIHDFLKFADNPTRDSELDKYSVNIGGMSFSFKLRYDNNGDVVPYFLSKHNHKVEVTLKSYPSLQVESFIVTDDKGIKYYFFDTDSEGPTNVQPEDPYSADRTTAWMLSKVEYLNNQQIIFNYEKKTLFTYNFSATGVAYENDIAQGAPGEGAIIYSAGYSDANLVSQVDRRILKSITFPKGKLEFSTIDRNDGSVTWQLFDQILLKDHTTDLVNTFDLDYTGNRDALTKIDKNGELYFGFEYFGVGNNPGFVPDFFHSPTDKPLDQDFYKFYNGANNEKAIDLGGFDIQANKEISFFMARIGAMNKIIYPTGGYSTITYGQNQIKKLYTESNSFPGFNKEVPLEIHPRIMQSNNDPNRHNSVTFTINYPVRAALSHEVKGDIDGNYIKALITGGEAINPACYTSGVIFNNWYPYVINDARSKMRPPNPADPGPCDPYYPYPLTPVYFSMEIGPENCPWYPQTDDFSQAMGCTSNYSVWQRGNSGGHFYLSPGTYTMMLTTRTTPEVPETSTFSTGEIDAWIKLDYYDPDPNGNGDPGNLYVNHDVGGIRVEKITHNPIQGAPYSTFYDYNDNEGFSTAVENQVPYTADTFDLTVVVPDGGSATIYDSVSYVHKLNTFGSLEAANGVPVYYKKIKKYTAVDYEFVPLDPGRSFTETPLQGDLNPDGSPVFRNKTPLGEWPPIVIIDGNPGQIFTSYPEGYSLLEFNEPMQDVSYQYPMVPRHLDKSGARMIEESQYNNEDQLISSNTNEYFTLRHDLDASSHGEYDNSSDHPWSFKIALSANRWVDFVNNCYELNQLCQDNIKGLYTFKKYKEIVLDQRIDKITSLNDGILSITEFDRDPNYFYNNKKTVITAEGDIIETFFDFPMDYPTDPNYQGMLAVNKMSIPVSIETVKNSNLLSKQKSEYSFGSLGYKPNTVLSSKGNNSLEPRLYYDSYDSNGNVTQVRKKDGVYISYLYGYGHNYPVAEIVGASRAQVLSALSQANYDYNLLFQSLTGSSLRNALNEMKAFLSQEAHTTFYTYKPLIGLESKTDTRGYTHYYHYDSQNRLEKITDEDNNIVEEYEYNLLNGN